VFSRRLVQQQWLLAVSRPGAEVPCRPVQQQYKYKEVNIIIYLVVLVFIWTAFNLFWTSVKQKSAIVFVTSFLHQLYGR
jgi:uncharacterized membrane protein YukC